MTPILMRALTMFALMFGIGQDGNVPPEGTPFMQQWQQTISTQYMLGAVEDVQAQVQYQEKAMTQAQGELPEPVGEAFQHMNGYLNQVRQDVEAGIVPLAFRARLSANRPADMEPQPDMVPGEANGPNGPGDGDCDQDCEPVGDQHQYGPESGGQNGPGDCDQDCVPAGDENHYGQSDDNSGQNGDGDCDQDCVPAGDENHNGQEDDNGGQNGK
ncbi:MAG: hypothetical protein P8183_11525 [Anaerolineae bacterium]